MASATVEEEVIIEFSSHQRWPTEAGEPVCIVCGRYGAYILDQTDEDVCSLECKGKRLLELKPTLQVSEQSTVYHEKVTQQEDNNSVEKEDKGEMTAQQLDMFYKEMGLEVRGSNIPRPITEWSQIPLDPQLKYNLKENGYHTLTPVQTQVIPAVLKRRDLLVSSPTGPFIALSFLLPLVQLMVTFPLGAPSVLILGPTRELCIQIEELAKKLMKGITDMKTALLIGGVPVAHQLHRLKSDIKLLIATPARLIDILTHHSKSINILSLCVLVLDEVDSLFQMGFEKQVQSIIDQLPTHNRQTLFFSATLPHSIHTLSQTMLHNSIYVSVGKFDASSVRHTVLWVEEETKKKQLFTFLKDKDTFHPPVVVFVSSRKGTLLLAQAIDKVCDVAAIALHGEMEQERRTAILDGFMKGKYEAIVATGVLARGLNLSNVQQVFIFDVPSSIDEFIHQVGRASRLGSRGWAVTFINNENKDMIYQITGVFKDIVNLLEPLGVVLPKQLLHFNELATRKRKRDHEERMDYKNKDSLIGLLQGSTNKWHKKH